VQEEMRFAMWPELLLLAPPSRRLRAHGRRRVPPSSRSAHPVRARLGRRPPPSAAPDPLRPVRAMAFDAEPYVDAVAQWAQPSLLRALGKSLAAFTPVAGEGLGEAGAAAAEGSGDAAVLRSEPAAARRAAVATGWAGALSGDHGLQGRAADPGRAGRRPRPALPDVGDGRDLAARHCPPGPRRAPSSWPSQAGAGPSWRAPRAASPKRRPRPSAPVPRRPGSASGVAGEAAPDDVHGRRPPAPPSACSRSARARRRRSARRVARRDAGPGAATRRGERRAPTPAWRRRRPRAGARRAASA
jgi:hypothetical protein